MGAKVGLPQSKVNDAHRMVAEKPWVVMLLSLAVLLLSLLPVLLVTHPLQVDIPNHLARHFIAENISVSEDLSRFYEVEWRAIPYLAGDMLHRLLSDFLSVYDASRVVLALIFLIWLSSAMILHRALWGSLSIWPLLSVLVFYNANVGWGLENYIIGSSFALLLFAGWVSWDTKRIGLKSIIFTILSTLLYFMHLFAFAVFGILYLIYELCNHWNDFRKNPISALKRLSIITLPMLPGTLHFLTMVISSEARAVGRTHYGGVLNPFQVLMASFSTRYYDMAIDPLILGCLLFLFLWGFTTKKLRLHPKMVFLLLIIGALCLVTPFRIVGIAGVFFRLPFIFVILLIASSRWEAIQPVRYWAAVAALGLLILVRSLMIVDYWQAHDTEVRELIQGFEKLERGAALLPVVSDSESNHAHSAAFATIERDAYVPNLFTGITLLNVRPGMPSIKFSMAAPHHIDSLFAALEAAKGGREFPEELLRQWWCNFSHVLVIDRQKPQNPLPNHLRLIHDGSFFTLYRNAIFDPLCQAQ